MKCEEYLQALSTSPIDEISRSAAAEHVATCVECNRVTRVVVERERRMAMALGGMSSHIEPLDTAMFALAAARRRMVGRMYKFGVGLLVVAAVVTFFLMRAVPPSNAGMITQSFTPRCLSAMEAAKLMKAILPPSALVQAHEATNILRVTATTEDMQKAWSWIDRYDNPGAASCVVPKPGSLKPETKIPTQ